tara:strand:- start:7355 stop:7798 length:444 start_codon:yes stop_codon:yes gene_type:complete
MSNKLSEEYPIVKGIKERMKNDKDISVDQIKSYDRRTRNSAFLKIQLEMLQEYVFRAERFLALYKKEQAERRRIECCVAIQADKATKAEEECARLRSLISKHQSEKHHSSVCPSAQPCYVPSLKVLASRALLVSPTTCQTLLSASPC